MFKASSISASLANLYFIQDGFFFHAGWFISGRKWGLILGLLHSSHFGATVTETGNCFNRRRLPPFFFILRAPAANVEVLSIRRGCLCSTGIAGSANVALCSPCLWCVKDCWVFVCVEGMVGLSEPPPSAAAGLTSRVSHTVQSRKLGVSARSL